MRILLRVNFFSFAAFFLPLFLLGGACFYRLNVESPLSLKIDPREYQPVALLPIPKPQDHPASAENLYSFLRDSLERKGYVLVKEAAVAKALEETELTPLLLLSDPDSLMKIGERLKAKLIFIATLPHFKVQKSYWGSQTFEVWDREGFDYMSLPTYHRGTSQIRMILRMFETEKGDLVWVTEGSIRASSDSAESYAEKLTERLLKGLPTSPLPTKD